MHSYEKQIKLKGLGAVTVTVTQLQKINSYSLTELKPEEIYVRKFCLAHNGIDRDSERFSKECLDGFMNTLPGKAVLRGHNKNEMPCGLFFDAYVETMSPEQFKALTGEEIKLPDSIKQAQVLYGWVYFLLNEATKDLIARIDAGIIRYVSIGFWAADLLQVKGELNQNLYAEYVPPAEALEGSIVWLGAQPGAVIKGAGTSEKESGVEQNKGKVNHLAPREERQQSKHPLAPKEDREEEEFQGKQCSPLDPRRPNKVKANHLTPRKEQSKHPLAPDLGDED